MTQTYNEGGVGASRRGPIIGRNHNHFKRSGGVFRVQFRRILKIFDCSAFWIDRERNGFVRVQRNRRVRDLRVVASVEIGGSENYDVAAGIDVFADRKIVNAFSKGGVVVVFVEQLYAH